MKSLLWFLVSPLQGWRKRQTYVGSQDFHSLSPCNSRNKYESWRKINVRRRHAHLILKKSPFMLSMLEKLFKGCSSMLKILPL